MGFTFTNLLELTMSLAGQSDLSRIDWSLVKRV